MYVETARASSRAASSAGATNQPTRSPGATVFENDEAYVTRAPALELEQRGRRLPFVADEAVRVVLEHRQPVLGGQLGDAPAPLGRERAAARVLEGRDRVEEADGPVRELARERVGIEPLVVHRHRATTSAPKRARTFSGRS